MNRNALSLVALLITAFGISAAPANAQARRKVTLEASVPFEFVIGNRAFPAGHYVFEMATGSPKATDQAGVLIVRDHERQFYVAVATDIAADTYAHVAPKLVFMRNGDHVYLAKVWRQGNAAGLSVPLAPGATAAEDWQESEALTLEATAVNGGV
jgi:hypothetical protein